MLAVDFFTVETSIPRQANVKTDNIPKGVRHSRRCWAGHRGKHDVIFSSIFEGCKTFRYCVDVPHNARPVHEVKANLFRVLGHPARVRILELLREGERSVGALQAELALDSGGTSQHLAALRRIGLVESRREGTSVFYRVDDEHVFDLLEIARFILGRRLAEQQAILRELDAS
jgi:ArsR family transcriptional regulator